MPLSSWWENEGRDVFLETDQSRGDRAGARDDAPHPFVDNEPERADEADSRGYDAQAFRHTRHLQASEVVREQAPETSCSTPSVVLLRSGIDRCAITYKHGKEVRVLLTSLVDHSERSFPRRAPLETFISMR